MSIFDQIPDEALVNELVKRVTDDYGKLKTKIAQRDEAIKVMREALIDIADYGENYAPEGKEIWLLAYTSLKKAEQILGDKP